MVQCDGEDCYEYHPLIGIETKDFFVSRVDEIIYVFGSTVRYTFTSIFGQVIGLIWRGIIEGLKK